MIKGNSIIQEHPLVTLYSIRESNITRSVETIIEFASRLMQATHQLKNEPLDVRHLMGAYIYHPFAHRKQLTDWNFNLEEWSNSLLKEISAFYPLELIDWITIHVHTFIAMPKIKFAGMENVENIKLLRKLERIKL